MKQKRLRRGAEQAYATFLQARARLAQDENLRTSEVDLLKLICQDIMDGKDPGKRFFQPVEGRPAGLRSVAIAADHQIRSDKAVARRWGISAQRVRALSSAHRGGAEALTRGLSEEDIRNLVDRLIEMHRSGTRRVPTTSPPTHRSRGRIV